MNALAQNRLDNDALLIQAAAFGACPEPIAIAENGKLIYSNSAFGELFETSRVPPPGIPFTQIFHGELSDQECAGTPLASRRLRISRSDGEDLLLEFGASLFRVGARKFLMLRLHSASAEAINAPREIPNGSAEPAQSLEALGRVAGAVAHDFNNLLTGILLYCDLLAAGLKENTQRGYVEEIRRAGGHSAELVQQLMTVARPEAESAPAHLWHEVVYGMRNLLERLLGENIELQLHFASPAGRVAMSSNAMRQIVLNLLLNARDAMPGGGRVILTARECHACSAGGCVELAVRDTGCGMDGETRSHLFETFFTTKAQGRGTGLGLATIQRVVREQHGEIRVESEPGRGTCMSVHLPRVPAMGEVAEISQARKTR